METDDQNAGQNQQPAQQQPPKESFISKLKEDPAQTTMRTAMTAFSLVSMLNAMVLMFKNIFSKK